MNSGTLTVLFEDPFWIGVFEMIDRKGLRACKVKFGAEPTEKEVMEFVDKNWHQLKFSDACSDYALQAERKPRINPKRMIREAKKQMQSQGIGTKSQQALKLQQEQNKTEHKQRLKAEREADKQRKFDLRQAKKKEKHKGH